MKSEHTLPPARRIVVVDQDNRSRAIADGPSPDIRTDAARPGFSLARMWVTARTPVPLKGVAEMLHRPEVLTPPAGGSLCRVVTLPPEDLSAVRTADIAAWFDSISERAAWTGDADGARHPYMQRTLTLEFALITHGKVVLVLDTAEVHLSAGDTVVLRGSNHAWSNRSGAPCRIAFSTHDARPGT